MSVCLQETLVAVQRLSEALGCQLSQFSFAGIKDRKAVTVQNVVVKGITADRSVCLGEGSGCWTHCTTTPSLPPGCSLLPGRAEGAGRRGVGLDYGVERLAMWRAPYVWETSGATSSMSLYERRG